MSPLKNLTFGEIVVAKTPNSQVKVQLVRKQNSGFEQSRPEYIRVFLPSSQNIVV
jgi:hypothetical protein